MAATNQVPYYTLGVRDSGGNKNVMFVSAELFAASVLSGWIVQSHYCLCAKVVWCSVNRSLCIV